MKCLRSCSCVWFVTCALLVGACSENGETPAPDASTGPEIPAALVTACKDIATAQCKVATACCSGASLNCQATAEEACANGWQSVWNGFGNGAVRVDAAGLQSCVAAIGVAGAACERPGANGKPNPCASVVVDITPVGKMCASGAAGTACGGGDGVCSALGGKGAVCAKPASEGEACDAAPCVDGLRCVNESATGASRVCRKPADKGLACVGHGDCAVGLACNASKTCEDGGKDGADCFGPGTCSAGWACDDTQGKCVAQVGEGKTCLAHRHCAAGMVCADIQLVGRCAEQSAIGAKCTHTSDCGDGLHCDINKAICTPQADDGDTCTSSDGCSALLYCDLQDKRCKPLPGEGQACAYSVRTCLPGLTCYQPSKTDRTCVKPRQKGQKCSQQNNCDAGLGCDKGVCVDLPNVGQACLDGLYCNNGWCDHKAKKCEAFYKDGASCHGGHECSPKSACVGTTASNLKCVGLPSKDQACLIECQPGLYCATKKQPGTCAKAVCSIGR